MSDPWRDDDDPRIREILGYQLRSHVAYQSGEDSLAPAVIFADADYEVGDGTCGLWPDGKQANEPAIVYARFDSVLALTARVKELEEALQPFSEVAGTLFAKNFNSNDLVLDHGEMRSDCLFFEDFLAARAALGKGE